MKAVTDNKTEQAPDGSFENEMKLKKFAGGLFALNRNGADQECPRMQGRLCSSQCPLFGMIRKRVTGGYIVTIGCGNMTHDIQEIIPYVAPAPERKPEVVNPNPEK
jgi:hypothetical protein